MKYKLELGDSGKPLVIFVHGRAGNINVMSTFKRCVNENSTKIFVEAPIPDPLGGFSWWLVDQEKEELKKSALSAAEKFMLELKEIIKKEQIEYKEIMAIGFSQGSALLSIVLQQHPTLFSRLAFLAGFVFKIEPVEVSNNKTKIFITHGIQDEVVTIDKAKSGAMFLESLGFNVTFHEDEVGHKVGTQGVRLLKEWLT